MTLDQAREAAVEAGYLVDHGKEAGGVGTTTVRSLLDAMAGELRGEKIYPAGTKPKVTAAELERLSEEETFRREQAEADIDSALQGIGFKDGDVTAAVRSRAIELMLKEGVHEPLDAYERASVEGPTIVAALDDLPPRAKEDAMRASIAALHDGTPVRAADMLSAAAKHDPRIAESVGDTLGPPEAPLRGQSANVVDGVNVGFGSAAMQAYRERLRADPGPAVDGDALWRTLADRPHDFADYGSLEASHAAQSIPEPASVSPEPNKRIQAALAAEAEAKAEFDASAAYLPDDLKERVDTELALLEAEVKDRNEVYNRGAACLASVAAGVAG